MTILTIQPVEYRGSRLEELGGKIVEIFFPLVENFTINNSILMIPHYVALDDKSILYFLPDYLKRMLSIVVTSLPIIDGSSPIILSKSESFDQKNLLDGISAKDYNFAFISNCEQVSRGTNSEMTIEILIKRTIHELGHLYGLEHHKNETSNGKLCPMTGFGNYIFSTDYFLCAHCYRSLGIPDPNNKN